MIIPLCKNCMFFIEILIVVHLTLAVVEVTEPVGNLSHGDNGAISHEKYSHPAAELERNGTGSSVADRSGVSSRTSDTPCIPVLFPSADCIPFTICDGTNPCHHGNCSVVDTNNFTCSCFDGYRSKGPGTPCETVNICEDGHCQQNCNKTAIGNECSCVDGFILDDDGISCIFDKSSTFVQCSDNCDNGTCLNNSCICFTGYYRAENGKCNRIDPCSTTPGICGENANCISNPGNYTCKCLPNFKNINGTCQEINPCDDLAIRQYCASYGKRCRLKAPGDYECYCALPYFPLKDDAQHDACIPPSTPFHMYNLSLELIGYYSDDGYPFLRWLEDVFYNELFPTIINVTVLNLEIKSVNSEPAHDLTHVNLYVYFAEEVPDLENLLELVCTLYPDETYSDACILPGMIVVRNSTLAYMVLDDVCNFDREMPEFLCGPLADCNANGTFYECNCNNGFEIGGCINPMKPICIDINECLRRNDTCASPTQFCVNHIGNYSCECILCFVWNEARTECLHLCQNSPCKNNGYCQIDRIQDTCGFQCTCSDEFKGPTCTEINDSVRTSRAAVSITGGVLGGLLALVIILGIVMIYKIVQRSGYFSFQTAKARHGI